MTKIPPPKHRPAAKQPAPKLQEHTLKAFQSIFKRELDRIEKELEGLKQENIVQSAYVKLLYSDSYQELQKALEELDAALSGQNSHLSIHSLNQTTKIVQYNEGALSFLNLVGTYFYRKNEFTESEVHEKIMNAIDGRKKGGRESRKLTTEVIADINNRYQELISEDWPITAAKEKVAEELKISYSSVNTATKQG